MSDPCFFMGCVECSSSDTCGECGHWTGARTAEDRRKASVDPKDFRPEDATEEG